MAESKGARTKTQLLLPSRERLREAAKRIFSERGYEATATSEICRLAGTSQSQLIKHFGGKLGLLEAIFEHAWERINPAIRLALEAVPAPREKLRILSEMVLNFLGRDREMLTLFLLEGRRIRGDGHMVVLVPGFLDFVKILDGVLKELQQQGELTPGINPSAMRSGIMGAFEGLLRDRLLARTSKFPAAYSEEDISTVFGAFISSCLKKT